ncbi:carotenoid oxygenase [Aspergillus filifer]
MTVEHFNNWPNAQGFDGNHEEKEPVEIPVTGHIPAYAAGVLYRTGPGRYKVDTENGNTFQVAHWFDGFSQTHRFQLVPSNAEDSESRMRVLYNSRFSTDELIEHARTNGSLAGNFCFGGHKIREERDPCKAMYQKIQTTYKPLEGGSSSKNTGVTLSVNFPGLSSSKQETTSQLSGPIKTLHAKSDNCHLKEINPETLEPISSCDQSVLHPDINGRLSASHAETDPETGDVFNYNLSFGRIATYRVFRVSAATGETSILASFPGIPSYMHSFFLTKNHVVICVWNAHISPQDLAKGSYAGALKEFDGTLPAKWYVVDRKHGNGLVATYESPAFFCFHTINAWEEANPDDSSKADIVAECITYKNIDIIKKLYYEYLPSNSLAAYPGPETKDNGGKTQSQITRFRLPDISTASRPVTPNAAAVAGSSSQEPAPELTPPAVLQPKQAVLISTSCASISPELPTHNPLYHTSPHRYTYTVVDRGHSTFLDGIMKFDSVTSETKIWSAHAQSPGEAIFVPDPNGKDEDDGVLLSVVLDGFTGNSYLLVLDARTMEEIGRASVKGVVAFGFHGVHVTL